MIWIGLTISFLTALTKCVADLRLSPGRFDARVFIETNKFTLLLGALAFSGFLCGCIAARSEQLERRSSLAALEKENNLLKILSISDASRRVVVSIALGGVGVELSRDAFIERVNWQEGDANRFPRPHGFMPEVVRSTLFQNSYAQDVTKRIGSISFRTTDLRIESSVRSDGSMITGTGGQILLVER